MQDIVKIYKARQDSDSKKNGQINPKTRIAFFDDEIDQYEDGNSSLEITVNVADSGLARNEWNFNKYSKKEKIQQKDKYGFFRNGLFIWQIIYFEYFKYLTN